MGGHNPSEKEFEADLYLFKKKKLCSEVDAKQV